MFIYTVDTVIALVIILAISVAFFISKLKWWIKHRNCKHDEFFENSSCDAICKRCRKNLGFIGKVRGDKG